MVHYLHPDRSTQPLNNISGQRTANSINEAAIDCEISTVINERFVLHVHEIDTPTLSSKYQQPSHQSTNNPLTKVSTALSPEFHSQRLHRENPYVPRTYPESGNRCRQPVELPISNRLEVLPNRDDRSTDTLLTL